MSHFVTLVILPPNTETESVENIVEEILEPYSIHLDAEEHETKCSCVGIQARLEVQAEIAKTVRKQFEAYPLEQKTVGLWLELMKPVVAQRDKLLAKHPLTDKPAPDCSDCNGTGVYRSCCNSYGKWDWWVIGGRWDGWIFGPEREDASRDKDGGFNFGDEHHTITNNSRRVSEIPIHDPHHVPFAVVTPQGEWIEQGEMGCWATVSNAKEIEHWHEIVKTVLNKFPDHLAVAVDCHM